MLDQAIDTEAFGSPAVTLRRVTSQLRAVAARHGTSLTEVSEPDAAGAAIAALCWSAAMGASRISDTSLLPPTAVAALSRVMLRAAGTPVTSPAPHAGGVPSDAVTWTLDAVLAVVADHPVAPAVLAAAAADLGDEHPDLAAAAGALLSAI